jgi:DnaJ-class molecular chaperone
MKCDKCNGSGKMPVKSLEYYRTCDRCGGFGIIHCCEGEKEQPEVINNE